MRAKPRYSNQSQINDKVDRANAKIDKFSTEAHKAEQKYRHLIQHGALADAAIQRKKADALYKQIEYQQDRRLPKLRDISGKLATDLLPWDGNNDKSVAA